MLPPKYINLLPILLTPVHAVDVTRDPTLNTALLTAATALDRQALLATDSQWTFDFHAQPNYSYTPGSVVNANAATFPAMSSTAMTLAMLNLGPCAMLPAHLHPRGTNVVVAVEGTTATFMVQENGARVVREVLTPGKMTIFPRGSVHTMQNMGKSSLSYLLVPLRYSTLLRISREEREGLMDG